MAEASIRLKSEGLLPMRDAKIFKSLKYEYKHNYLIPRDDVSNVIT